MAVVDKKVHVKSFDSLLMHGDPKPDMPPEIPSDCKIPTRILTKTEPILTVEGLDITHHGRMPNLILIVHKPLGGGHYAVNAHPIPGTVRITKHSYDERKTTGDASYFMDKRIGDCESVVNILFDGFEDSERAKPFLEKLGR